MNKTNSYSSPEKLKSRKALESLFTSGQSFSVFPVKVFYTLDPVAADEPRETPVNAGVGVSSKNFRKAVQRNRIKRLLREAYRTQKQTLLAAVKEQQHVSVFFLYIGKELPEFALLNQSMGKALEKFIEKLNKA
ncbi:MAG: ribonuclease P protein component [Sphingobacteriia bacterium]|nr:ribonuclease P protein component [Sphingobacteriia bacterium]